MMLEKTDNRACVIAGAFRTATVRERLRRLFADYRAATVREPVV